MDAQPALPPASSPPPTLQVQRKGRRRLGCLAVVAVLLACTGIEFYRSSRFDSMLATADAARNKGDCAAALSLYDRAVANKSLVTTDSTLSEIARDKQECQALLDVGALQTAGKSGDALLGYKAFLAQHASSALVTPARQQAQALFTAAKPAAIATVSVCKELDNLLKGDLVPDRATNLPLLYAGCGQAYFDAGDNSSSVAVLQKLGTEFPDHPQRKAVEPLLASAIIAEAKQMGAGGIPAPESTGAGSGSGPTKVVIQNDSPEEISLVFKGPDTRLESIPPCKDCQEFTKDAPSGCPKKGPIGTYELTPGTYAVVVRSISSSGVVPFSGSWELAAGDEYYSCFYLVSH